MAQSYNANRQRCYLEQFFIGTALIATIGILWFEEPISVLKIGSLALIILGVIGLNLSGVGH